jgi:hypothetical protein
MTFVPDAGREIRLLCTARVIAARPDLYRLAWIMFRVKLYTRLTIEYKARKDAVSDYQA